MVLGNFTPSYLLKEMVSKFSNPFSLFFNLHFWPLTRPIILAPASVLVKFSRDTGTMKMY